MSQYPSPYYPPNLQPPHLSYWATNSDALAPARRASVMMFVIGGLLTMLGVCDIFQAAITPLELQIQRAHQMQGMNGGADAVQISDQILKVCLIGFPILFVVIGSVYITLAVGVRRGGRASTIVSLVLTSIILVGLLLMALVMLIAGLANPLAFLFACMMLIPVGMMAPLTVWLIKTLRTVPGLASAQQQYLAQYWQYQQNTQEYTGYGYAAPPQEGQAYPAPPPSTGGEQLPPPPDKQ